VVLDLRRARVELPPPPSDPLEEVPKTHFGSVTYPTEEELIKRQQSQIHINDEPTVSRTEYLTLLAVSLFTGNSGIGRGLVDTKLGMFPSVVD